MNPKFLYFLTVMALVSGLISVQAQTSNATVATVPVGMINYPLTKGTTTYLSLPLTNIETYTGSVSAATGNSISVGDDPAPFTTSLAAPGTPYFVKFLSGSEAGRVLLVTGNTTSTLTLDTADHATGSPVALNATGYSVETGDTFEVFPGDTLASVFGAGTAQSPLVVTGGASAATADSVALFTAVNAPAVTYYFNTTANAWEQTGSTANANNTILYPYAAFAVTLQSANPSTALVLGGRVTSVASAIKVVSNGTIFASTQFAADVKLSQLQFGGNWVTGSSVATADTLSVWNPSEGHFDTYYEKSDSTWRKFPDAATDQSSFSVSAGSVTTIAKRGVVNGAASFLQAPLPYSLD